MKHSLFTLTLLLLISSFSFAQDYAVIQVKGKINNQTTGDPLKPGMKLKPDDKVNFVDDDAVAVLFSAGRGRFTLSAKKKAGGSDSEFIAYLKDNLSPSKSSLNTRGGTTIMNLVDFKNHFGSCTYLLLEEGTVTISKDFLEMNEQSFVFLRYQWKGETINKKLAFEGQELKLDPSAILKVDGEPITGEDASEFEFYYFNGGEKTSAKLSDFTPAFIHNEELLPQVEALVKVMQDNDVDRDAIIQEVNGYLVEFYGHPDRNNLEDWLNSHFGI